ARAERPCMHPARLITNELIPYASSAVDLSNALKSLARGDSHNEKLYENILKPCLLHRTSIRANSHTTAGHHPKPCTVEVQFHEHGRFHVPDFFSAIGRLLSSASLSSRRLNTAQRIELLAAHAKLCKLSAPLVQARAPTTVQILWTENNRLDTRIALGSSLAWVKDRELFQMARAVRRQTLADLWSSALATPTPMQRVFPASNNGAFGSCWGDCAEANTLAALWRSVQSGTPLGTLAFNVASLNAVHERSGQSACDVILSCSNPNPDHLFSVLKHANALRPMCRNCLHLKDALSARIVDFAIVESHVTAQNSIHREDRHIQASREVALA
ncbi:unnamed protein product, partial [Mycena citricolor]